MATMDQLKQLEVREAVNSAVIERLRAIADGGKVEAYSLRYRHKRFKNRLSIPHYFLSFRAGGRHYTEDAATLANLDSIIERDHLATAAAPAVAKA